MVSEAGYDLSDQEQLRKYLMDEYLPAVLDDKAPLLRAMVIAIKAADQVGVEFHCGEVEWVLLTYGTLTAGQRHEYAWCHEHGWDGEPPFAEVICRLDDALLAALDLARLP